MNKHYLVLPVLLMLGIASFSYAQFTPPKLSPGCNPSAAGCNIAPPINVGENQQIKNAAVGIGLKDSINSWGSSFIEPLTNWKPILSINSNSPNPTPFGFDTNGSIRAQYHVGETMRVGPTAPAGPGQVWLMKNWLNNNQTQPAGSGLFLPYAADPMFNATGDLNPTEQTLCVSRTSGLIKKCANSSGGTGGGTPITIKVEDLIVDGVSNTGFDNDPTQPNRTKQITTPNAHVILKWKVTADINNVVCWSTGTVAPSVNQGSALFSGTSDFYVNKEESWSLTCRHKTTSQVAHKQVVFEYNPPSGGTPPPSNLLPADVILRLPEGGMRYRDNNLPIKLQLTVNANGSETICKYDTFMYGRTDNQPIFLKPGNNVITDNINVETTGCGGFSQPSCNRTVAGYSFKSNVNMGSDNSNKVIINKSFTCNDFFTNCNNSSSNGNGIDASGTRTVDFEVACYNNKSGQTASSPLRKSVHLEWTNPVSQ